MRVVYLDTLFFLNAIVDYLLLLGAARLVGEPLHRGRFALAAVLGGLYAVLLFLPGGAFLARSVCRLASCALMAVVAYGGSRRLLRQTVVFFALACGFGGAVICIESFLGAGMGSVVTSLDLKTMLLAAALFYGVLSLGFQRIAAHTACSGQLIQADLWLKGKHVSLMALIDSGNTLADPATGMPVVVVEGEQLKGLFPKHYCPRQEDMQDPAGGIERLGTGEWKGRFRLLPFRSVGIESGLLLSVKVDRLVLAGEERGSVLVALSPTPVSDGGGYCALVGSMN